MESFFNTLELELGESFAGKQAAQREPFDYIEACSNGERLHTTPVSRNWSAFVRLKVEAGIFASPTFPVYALGDPSLGPEATWGASPTLGLRLPWVEAEVSANANYIDDFVYFAPEIGKDGSPAVDVTVQGAFPRFSYRPIDALFYGNDGGVTFGPEAVVGLRVQGALVRAIDAGTGGALVMIPADRVEATAKLSPRNTLRHLPPENTRP
jgi:hypothetical protein